jgi:protocatechuate 3,4-dioxygenase beta subunit
MNHRSLAFDCASKSPKTERGGHGARWRAIATGVALALASFSPTGMLGTDEARAEALANKRPVNEINVADPAKRYVKVVASDKPPLSPHEIHGTVLDADGKPAKKIGIVVIGVTNQADLARQNGGQRITAATDANGKYQIRLETPWIRRITASMTEGFEDHVESAQGLPLGEHNFQLKPVSSLRLNGILLEVDGRPAAGTMVYLRGLDRMNIVGLDEAAKRPHYHVKTDAQGRFAFDFKAVPEGSGGHYESPADGLPYFGDYCAVVPPAADGSHAGAVSDRIYNEWPKDDPGYYKAVIPRVINMTKHPGLATLRLAKGVEFTGRVLDAQLRPQAGITVGTLIDLHAETHTGWGGQIFERATKTDAQGRFRFENLYPSKQTVHLGGENEPSPPWQRTRVGRDGKWVDDRVDQIDMADPRARYAEILSDPELTFVYQGTVRDKLGKPVAGARVNAGFSYHKTQRDYSDSHASRGTSTNAQGHYRLEVETPWIYGMGPCKDGYKGTGGKTTDEFIPPGTYDFALEQIPPLKLEGTVLGVGGRPAAGTELCLLREDLGGSPVDFDQAIKWPAWHARADAEGRFEFLFLRPTGDGDAPSSATRPGNGGYYVAVPPARDGSHAAAVSDMIVNSNWIPERIRYDAPRLRYQAFGKDGAPIQTTLRLTTGVEIQGRVLDAETSRPLAGQSVTLYPGPLGEKRSSISRAFLMGQSVKTDAEGRFQFVAAPPTTATLTVAPAKAWTRTRLGKSGQWIDDRVNRLDFGKPENRNIEVATSERARFELRGTVRDETTGLPVEGAEVYAGVASHRGEKLNSGHYEEDSRPETKTDANGRYRIMAATPWIVYLEANKHYGRQIGPVSAPGTYDFKIPSSRK